MVSGRLVVCCKGEKWLAAGPLLQGVLCMRNACCSVKGQGYPGQVIGSALYAGLCDSAARLRQKTATAPSRCAGTRARRRR